MDAILSWRRNYPQRAENSSPPPRESTGPYYDSTSSPCSVPCCTDAKGTQSQWREKIYSCSALDPDLYSSF